MYCSFINIRIHSVFLIAVFLVFERFELYGHLLNGSIVSYIKRLFSRFLFCLIACCSCFLAAEAAGGTTFGVLPFQTSPMPFPSEPMPPMGDALSAELQQAIYAYQFTETDTLPDGETPASEEGGNFLTDPDYDPFELDMPTSIDQEVEYDPETGTYVITESVGGRQVSPATYMSFDEYWEWKQDQIQNNYWETQERSGGSMSSGTGLLPPMYQGPELFPNLFSITGDDAITIRPTGSIDLELGFRSNRNENPNAYTFQQSQVTPHFDMNINMGVIGKIGDKMKVNLNYNTKSVFNFDNQVRLEYVGDEDEIVQEVRAGDVNFPLPTTLIPGSQSLFGIQSKLKFGRLTVNSVISQQRSKARQLVLESGGQVQEFEITADQYDENRHFFVGHYFRDNYEKALETFPYINSPVFITRMDVYVNDSRIVPEDAQRDIVAFSDLGEYEPFNENVNVSMAASKQPSNETNDLYGKLYANPNVRQLDQVTSTLSNPAGEFQLEDIRDFRKTNARKLEPDEFTYDPQLGFISLNFALRPNEVLAVAYEYTTIYGGQYRVGELAEDVFNVDQEKDPRVLFVKMLKSSTPLLKHPMWDLMMKNVYALGAYQVAPEDFRLDVYYENPGGGDLRYIPEGEGIKGNPLIKLLDLDRLNSSNEPYPDGVFDFYTAQRNFDDQLTSTNLQNNILSFGTLNTRNGRLIFPVLEPFGDHIRNEFLENGNLEEMANQYAYDYLYDSTKTVAADFPEFNRFFIRGEYKSEVSSEISLGAFNLPQGSVRVTAGGRVLQEGIDYQVDYNLGRVTILNDAYINAGTPINVSYEDNGTFGLQQRTYLGTRLDYKVNEDFNIGGTFVRLSERPFTPKVNYGEDPIANSMVGLDMNLFKEAPGITKFVDWLPGISTKEPSSVTFSAEGAGLLPGHAKAINKEGVVYVDDFESAYPELDLSFPFINWSLASTPKGALGPNGVEMFPEAALSDSLTYGYNRAKIAWYQPDPIFCSNLGNNSGIPGDVTSTEACSNHYSRIVSLRELFPEQVNNQGSVFANNLTTFDLAYYPSEPGPYNYDTKGVPGVSAGLDEEGKLNDPESRWGGIMRNSPYKDFEVSNVEFIEFWMMDPFIYPELQDNDGYMYIDLGNVSEDVMKDSRQFFENSLPGPGEVPNLDQSAWGNVTKLRPINEYFDTNSESRREQDIGFDGLKTEEEIDYFADFLDELEEMVSLGELDVEAFENIKNDPARDNFYHFRDAYYDSLTVSNTALSDRPGDGILLRYQNFNGPEGNSRTQDDAVDDLDAGTQQATFTRSATIRPEMEDLNGDWALNDSEDYFQYRIPLRPSGEMQVGEGYLLDVIDREVTLRNDETESVRWYYFRVPVDQFTNKVGNVNLRNIEFIRMYMTGFDKPVVARMVNFNLVRGNWREYSRTIREEGEYVPSNPDDISESFFNMTSLGIQENSEKIPIPYSIPPRVEREIVPTGSFNQILDERSVMMQVGDLKDGDGKAIYKRVNMDMRRFGKLEMFCHMEQLNVIEGCMDNTLDDGDVTAFIRLGDDFEQNYYEYEIPLVRTLSEEIPADFNNDSEADRSLIWKLENEMVIPLKQLVDLKLERKSDVSSSPHPVYKPYQKFLPRQLYNGEYMVTTEGDTLKARVTVVGSPDLSRVKNVMLGVRNPKRNAANKDSDDGLEKCAEVWFNELRLSDFDESPGWAALARMDVKLADLGTASFSANMHTAGFGTLEQRVVDRYQDNYVDFDASTNLQLGKFLPEKSGIRIPLYAGISRSISTPEYDPYDGDIILKEELDTLGQLAEQGFHETDTVQEYRKQTQTINTIKSVNVTNVRKERTNPDRKPKVYDIENFSATYAFVESELQDPIIEEEKVKRHTGSLAYTYNARPAYIEPFKKAIKSKSLYLRLIKDFNFNLVPSSITLRTDMNRRIGTLRMRTFYPGEISQTYYDKAFTWDRNYGFKYNPTKSISLDFSANNTSVIDEPQNLPGKEVKDTIWTNIRKLGRNRLYDQTANVSYNLPLDKIPFLSWTQVRARYGSTYFWEARPLGLQDSLGNTMGNSQNIQLNGELNLTKLYNSIPYLKKINQSRNRKSSRSSKSKDKEKDKGKNAEADKKKKSSSKNSVSPIARALIRPLMSLRRISLTYNERNSTVIPGFMREHEYLGLNFMGGQQPMPGWDFVFGAQPDLRSWLEWGAKEDIISKNRLLNDQVRQTSSVNITGRANIEPYRGLKIDLNANMTYNFNHSEFYKVGQDGVFFDHFGNLDAGSYTISYLTWRTAFGDKADTTGITQSFRNFEDYRVIMSERLSALNPESSGDFITPIDTQNVEGYQYGYGPYAQEVLMPAFLAAYTGRDPQKFNLNALNLIPIPNWRFSYNGLSKLPGLDKIFNSVNLTHGYTNNLSIGGFQNNLYYDDRYFYEDLLLLNDNRIIEVANDEFIYLPLSSDIDTLTGNFQSYHQVPRISINEQFSPLLGIEMTFANDLNLSFDYKRSRTLDLSLQAYRMAESRSSEIAVGAGYTWKEFQLPIKLGGREIVLDNDLSFNFDMGISDRITRIYLLDQDAQQEASGNKTIRIAPSIDYVISDQLRISLFYERTKNIPYTSASFVTVNSKGGIRVNFTLAQ